MAIVDGAEEPKESSVKVRQNLQLFEGLVAGCKGDFAAVCKGPPLRFVKCSGCL